MKFKVKPPLPAKPDGVLSLEKEDESVVLRLQVDQSVNIRIITFDDGGQVHIRYDRMKKFGLILNETY